MFNILPVSLETFEAQRLRNTFLEANENPNDFILQPKQLRVHVLLKNNNTSYQFDLKNGQINNYSLDQLLSENDRFYCYALGFQIFKQNNADGAGQLANTQRFTYPDSSYFVGNDSTNPKEYEALYTIYNGTIDLKTDVLTYITGLTCDRFLLNPERDFQKQAAPQINDAYPQFGGSLPQRGMYYLGTQIPINGQKQNRATLNLGEGNTAVIDGSIDSAGEAVDTRNVLCLCLEGFLAVNAAAPVQKY